jgi:hypothetical protein
MMTTTKPEGELAEAGQALLDAAQAYWDAYHRARLHGSVVWLQGSGGELVVFTRGEYTGRLKEAVHSLDG